MQLRKDIADRLLKIAEFQSLPDHERINYALLIGSLIWHTEKLLGNIKCEANIVKRKRESEFSEKKIVFYLPILSGKYYLSLKLSSNYPFGFCDYQLVNSIIITYSIAVDEVISIKYDGLSYSLFEYVENLVIAIYVAEMSSSYWEKEITERTTSGIFEFFSELSNKRYEGAPPELSVSILPKKMRRKASFDPIDLNSYLFSSKKTLALFKGHRHLLECDLNCKVRNVRTLQPYPDSPPYKNSPIYVAPYEYQPTFEYSRREKALVYILNRHGDIMIVLEGALILYRKEGIWRIFSAENFIETITSSLSEFNTHHSKMELMDVFSIYLGMLSFSLRNNRKGGLIVVGRRDDIGNLLPKDKYENDSVETFYQNIFIGKVLPKLPVSLLCNALSVDGATLIDIDGAIIKFGIILNTKAYRSEKEGARTKAAEYASRYGIAIKISEDGPITIYKKSNKIYQVD